MTIDHMLTDLLTDRATDLRQGRVSFGRTSQAVAGQGSRYRVTVQAPAGAYFIGYVQQVQGTWVAVSAWDRNAQPFGHSATRQAAGDALRAAAIVKADADLAAQA